MRLGRRQARIIYAACAAAVFAGLAWLTWQAVELEGRERRASLAADLQESLRLALWRMDSRLAPIIAQEAARPYFHYRSFFPADRAYTRMWEQVEPGEVLVPSPLLAGPGEFILLHFEVAPDGAMTSPQAPIGSMRAQAAGGAVSPEQLSVADSRLAALAKVVGGRSLAQDEQAAFDAATPGAQPPPASQDAQDAPSFAMDRSQSEYQNRKQTADAARGYGEREATRQMQSVPAPAGSPQAAEPDAAAALEKSPSPSDTLNDRRSAADRDQPRTPARIQFKSEEALGAGGPGATAPADAPIVQGPFDPLWRTGGPGEEPQLVFIRRVTIGHDEFLQGFWVDWPAVRESLLAQVQDLLPGADLRPVYSGSAQLSEMLAAMPAVIAPGAPGPVAAAILTPTRAALALTWAAVIGAVVAVGIVLRKSIDLAERRGQFVSAVTHELRTPLTTFCLYTQMLADGMVQGEEARADYLGTLKRESRRLARIVENVLEYARLGQRTPAPHPAQAVEDLVASVAPGLSDLASRAGMDLVIDQRSAEGAATPADTPTVERILTNLVENSTKYAADAADRRLHLTVSRSGPVVEFRYRDHGPGIPRSEESRVFQPFHRAARDADGPAPGLGLGLALARGLARQLGGDLRLAAPAGDGAEFVLTLPAS